MADRSINIKISATDNASNVFAKASAALKQLQKETEVFEGPQNKPRFDDKELEIRKKQAEIVRQMRDDADRAAIESEAKRRLFGEEESKQVKEVVKEKKKADEEPVGILDKLKDAFGRGSSLKEVSEILAGGGVVAGFSLLGSVTADWAGKVGDAVSALRSGKSSIGEVVEAAAAGVPIFGSWWQAGRNIREIFTGEAAETSRILDNAEKINRTLDAQKALADEFKLTMRSAAEESGRLKDHLEQLKLPEPQRTLRSIADDAKAQAQAISDQRDDEIKKLKEYVQQKTSEANKLVLPNPVSYRRPGHYIVGDQAGVDAGEQTRQEIRQQQDMLSGAIADANKKIADLEAKKSEAIKTIGEIAKVSTKTAKSAIDFEEIGAHADFNQNQERRLIEYRHAVENAQAAIDQAKEASREEQIRLTKNQYDAEIEAAKAATAEKIRLLKQEEEAKHLADPSFPIETFDQQIRATTDALKAQIDEIKREAKETVNDRVDKELSDFFDFQKVDDAGNNPRSQQQRTGAKADVSRYARDEGNGPSAEVVTAKKQVELQTKLVEQTAKAVQGIAQIVAIINGQPTKVKRIFG